MVLPDQVIDRVCNTYCAKLCTTNQDMICVMLQLGHFGSSCQLAKKCLYKYTIRYSCGAAQADYANQIVLLGCIGLHNKLV